MPIRASSSQAKTWTFITSGAWICRFIIEINEQSMAVSSQKSEDSPSSYQKKWMPLSPWRFRETAGSNFKMMAPFMPEQWNQMDRAMAKVRQEVGRRDRHDADQKHAIILDLPLPSCAHNAPIDFRWFNHRQEHVVVAIDHKIARQFEVTSFPEAFLTPVSQRSNLQSFGGCTCSVGNRRVSGSAPVI